MPRFPDPAIFIAACSTRHRLARQVRFLREENRILRAKLPARISTTPGERARLLRFGLPLGDAIKGLISIVRPEAFARWVRKGPGRRRAGKTGRPRTPEEIRALIVRIARETGWGSTRVLGELRKLGVANVSRTTVRRVLKEHGIDPAPKRGGQSWDEFIRAHAETLWACDFFSKRIFTRTGIRTAYALVFLNVKTRRVIVSPSTVHPTRTWSGFQAHAFVHEARRQGLPSPTVLIRDGDGKYGASFNAALRDWGCEPKRLPPGTPNLNAYVEPWVKSIKVGRLDRFVVLGTDHFDHLASEYVAHYHEERPHQGIGNELILNRGPPAAEGAMTCSFRLGGVLKAYRRAA